MSNPIPTESKIFKVAVLFVADSEAGGGTSPNLDGVGP